MTSEFRPITPDIYTATSGEPQVGEFILTDPATELIENSRPFFNWLMEWQAGRPSLDLAAEMQARGLKSENVAILSADMVNGFCYEGNLASPRIAALVPAIVGLFKQAHALGIRNFVLAEDHHDPNALEFRQYGPHCIVGSSEAQTIAELANLPFANDFTIVPKNCLSFAIHTDFSGWLREHPEVKLYIVVGDCTDLCVYQMAMYMRMEANARNVHDVEIIAPMNMVDTYDLSVETAQRIGALPHDADLLHPLFLYHLALNGVQIVSDVK
ncbi:MAG: nicotinamidase [Candidatus Chloroheliales bacterium]|nr:MAG: nicotinamidase [Chloroflexota bacterium]